MKPVIAVLWILSIALAVGLSRLAEPDRVGAESSISFEEAFGEFAPLERAYLISSSLRNLDSDNLPGLVNVLENRNIGIVPEEVKLIMLAWARFDAPAAYEWAIVQKPEGWRTRLTLAAIYAWGYYDGPAAIRVAEAVENPETMARLQQNAMEGWLRGGDKKGYSAYIANFPDMKRRGRLYFLLAGEIVMSEGNEAAMRWAEALPDDMPNQLKPSVFGNVARMVASEDPLRAAEWFLEHGARPYSKGALPGIALRWVQLHDRPAAFEWLLATDRDATHEGEVDDAIAQGFRSWMQLDSEAAQAWLLTQLPNPALDPAVYEALRHLLPKDPGASMLWVQRLDDEEKRRSQLVRVGIRWRDKDPEGFTDWLAESDLPEEIRQKIEAAPREARRKAKPGPAAAQNP